MTKINSEIQLLKSEGHGESEAETQLKVFEHSRKREKKREEANRSNTHHLKLEKLKQITHP